jgi:hypothetical protein
MDRITATATEMWRSSSSRNKLRHCKISIDIHHYQRELYHYIDINNTIMALAHTIRYVTFIDGGPTTTNRHHLVNPQSFKPDLERESGC